jgi:hypothetical protein
MTALKRAALCQPYERQVDGRRILVSFGRFLSFPFTLDKAWLSSG